MRDEHGDGDYPDRSRRRFLEGAAALAAAGAAAAVAGPAAPIFAGTQQSPESSLAPGDCDCSTESALPLLAAAMVHGAYVGLASTDAGPGLFSLTVDGQAVSLGAVLPAQVPAGLQPTSLGVARNRLALGGGLPFLWRSYVVDDRLEPIHVFGIRPAAFFVDSGVAEPIALPDMQVEAFATVGGIAETHIGNLVVMIEHSGGEPESRYAAAVDVFEEAGVGWSIRASARDLGESGPNHLVVDGDAVSVEVNTSRGTQFIGAGTPALPSAARALSPDVLGDDEVVSIVPVAGVKRQAVVIGKRSARLVEEVAHVL